MVTVWTARMGYRGADYLDITLDGNKRRVQRGEAGGHRGIGAAFAPSSKLLYPFLAKRMRGELLPEDWAVYRSRYIEEMRVCYRTRRSTWEALLALDQVTLLCFCKDHARCHRSVLAEILGKLGANVAGERAR